MQVLRTVVRQALRRAFVTFGPSPSAVFVPSFVRCGSLVRTSSVSDVEPPSPSPTRGDGQTASLQVPCTAFPTVSSCVRRASRSRVKRFVWSAGLPLPCSARTEAARRCAKCSRSSGDYGPSAGEPTISRVLCTSVRSSLLVLREAPRRKRCAGCPRTSRGSSRWAATDPGGGCPIRRGVRGFERVSPTVPSAGAPRGVGSPRPSGLHGPVGRCPIAVGLRVPARLSGRSAGAVASCRVAGAGCLTSVGLRASARLSGRLAGAVALCRVAGPGA